MQVTSAVLAGMVFALENPKAGIVEADEMDFRRCLEVQTPYLGPVGGFYTDWTPLDQPAGPVSRGHRRERPLAVPQRARPVGRVWRRFSGAAQSDQRLARPFSVALSSLFKQYNNVYYGIAALRSALDANGAVV